MQLKNTSVEELMILLSNNYTGFKAAAIKVLIQFYGIPKEYVAYFTNNAPVWDYLRAFIHQYEAWNPISAKSAVIKPIESHFEDAYKSDLAFQKLVDSIDENMAQIKALTPTAHVNGTDNQSLIFYLHGIIPEVYKALLDNFEGFIDQFIGYSNQNFATQWKNVKWNNSNIKADPFYVLFQMYLTDCYAVCIDHKLTNPEKISQLKIIYTKFLSKAEPYKLDLINAKYLEVLGIFKGKGFIEFDQAMNFAYNKQHAFLEKIEKKPVEIIRDNLNELLTYTKGKIDEKQIELTIQYSILPEYFEKAVYDGTTYTTLPITINRKFKQGLSQAEYDSQTVIKVYLQKYLNPTEVDPNKRKEYKYNIPELQSDYSMDIPLTNVRTVIKDNQIKPKITVTQAPTQMITTTDCVDKVLEEYKKAEVAGKKRFYNSEYYITSFLKDLNAAKYYCKDITINPNDKKAPNILVCEITFTEPIFQGTDKTNFTNIITISNSLKSPGKLRFGDAKVTDIDKLTILLYSYGGAKADEEEQQSTIPAELKPKDQKLDFSIPTIPQLKYQDDSDIEPRDVPDEYIMQSDDMPVKIEDVEPTPPAWYERAWFVWGLVGLALTFAVLTIYLTRKNKKRGQ